MVFFGSELVAILRGCDVENYVLIESSEYERVAGLKDQTHLV